MRRDLSLFLSVAAAIALGLSLSPMKDDGVGAIDAESSALAQSLATVRAALASRPPTLPDASPQATGEPARRTLFPAAIASAAPPPMLNAPVAPAPQLVLRGIVELASFPRAIFGVDDQSQPYRSVGLGDDIDGWRVETIDADAVTLRRPDGELETYRLRGAGEAPN